MTNVRHLRGELERVDGALSAAESGQDTFSMVLMRQSLELRRTQVESELEAARRARLQVVFTGEPVIGHSIKIDALTQFLGALQESVSSVAQALTGKATSRAAIPGPLRDLTSFRFTEHFAGSFGVTLEGPTSGDEDAQPTFEWFDEVPTVLDQSVEVLIDVFTKASTEVVDDDPIIDLVLPLGSRSFKHLNDLAKSVTEERLVADIIWNDRTGIDTAVHISPAVASRLEDVLGRNKVTDRQVELDGHLGTVSDIRNRVELRTTDDSVVPARVIEELIPLLGTYYSRNVHATFDVTVVRSLVTGVERETYVLIGLSEIDETPSLSDE